MWHSALTSPRHRFTVTAPLASRHDHTTIGVAREKSYGALNLAEVTGVLLIKADARTCPLLLQ
jgi:hypothetical protein